MANVEFDEVRFPTDVSYGSSGGPTFKTSIFEAFRGGEKRNIDWASPLMEFNVAYGIKTDAQMEKVIEFFQARRGRLRGFRYKNWANYQVVNGVIAVGDAVSTRFPIIRAYGFPAAQTYKRLYKIVPGSVTGLNIAGETLVEGVDYAIDYNSGELVFRSDRVPGFQVPIKVTSLEFDEPVRFDIDRLDVVIEQYNNNSIGRLPLIGIRDKFTFGTVPAPDAVASQDPLYTSVRLLLKFDDVSNLATTVDQSSYSQIVTVTPPATLTTASAAFGGSATFGATGHMSVDGAILDLSDPAVPFTIEAFFRRPVGNVGDASQLLWGKWDASGTTRGYGLFYQPFDQRLIYKVSADGSVESNVLNYPWTEGDDGDWQHISIDRLPTGLHVMRINGTVVQTSISPGSFFNPTTPFQVGGFATPQVDQGSYQGGIDALRVTYGRNRYTGITAITPPRADYPA